MQKIERYGVIALLLLLVTIVAVAFWNEEAKDPAGEPLARKDPAPSVDPRPMAANRPNATPRNPGAGAGPQPQGARTPANPVRDASARGRIDEAGVPLDPAARPNPAGAQRPFAPEAGAGGGGAGEVPLRFAAGETAGNPAPASTPLAQQQPIAPQPLPSARTQPEAERPATTPLRGDAPAGAAAANRSAAATAAPREVRVEAGDSLARIALRHLGSESHWTKLADYNGISDPRRLQAGQRLRLPPLETLASAPAASPAATAPAAPPSAPRPTPTSGKTRLYTVQRGEVLGQIAQRECGSVKAVPTIVALNPGLDPNRVAAGQQILLPVGEGQRPADTQVALATPPAGSRAATGAAAARRNVVQ